MRACIYSRIDYVPALYKIFDEILVNAADNAMRDPKGMDLIDVTIDRHWSYAVNADCQTHVANTCV